MIIKSPGLSFTSCSIKITEYQLLVPKLMYLNATVKGMQKVERNCPNFNIDYCCMF